METGTLELMPCPPRRARAMLDTESPAPAGGSVPGGQAAPPVGLFPVGTHGELCPSLSFPAAGLSPSPHPVGGDGAS